MMESWKVRTHQERRLAEEIAAANGAKRKMADEVVNTIEDLHAINDAYDQLLCDEAPTSVFCLRKSERHQDNEKQEIYEFHAPSSILVSPNKLALQQQDVSSLDEIFNLVISCIRQNSTSVAAVKEYDDYHRDQQGNA
ncbi:hypothetical protein G6F42_013789 [Rhizopus arrhizus]|nr:hypothetical protein G6F42_013789 [Rhizopus arrhizus]